MISTQNRPESVGQRVEKNDIHAYWITQMYDILFWGWGAGTDKVTKERIYPIVLKQGPYSPSTSPQRRIELQHG